MRELSLAILSDGRKAAIIRTSDRISFKSCRRKWGFSSHMKMNLAPKSLSAPLWFGSAIHYALEDYHGYNKFGRPADAFRAYCIATAQNYKRELPSDAQDLWAMGVAMMDYYVDMWLAAYPRIADATYWCPNYEGGPDEPQVEVNFEIPIPTVGNPILERFCRILGIDVVLYRGTIDRVGIDNWGNLWVIEYKTAKVLAQQHYQTDPQVTTYVWACQQIYDKPIAGVIYQQFIKKIPKGPSLLGSGGFSTAQNQVTSYPLYKRALEGLYGDVMKAPSKNQAYLNQLIKGENTDRDRYIIRDRIDRNPQQAQNEAWKILMELEDMLNPDLPLYPNPTRDCSRMCSFTTPCINMDDGSDWEDLLLANYSSRDDDMERMWRRRLPAPAELWDMVDRKAEPDLQDLQVRSMEEAKLASMAAGDYEPAEWEAGSLDTDGTKNPLLGMDEKGSFNMANVEIN